MAKQADKNQGANDNVRLDRWLWAARFFKTRALATEAIRGGHVQVNGQRVKPAKGVTIGDRLEIRKGELTFLIGVLELTDKRVSAPIAQTLYQEEPESLLR
ncbi:MAG: RNA-binding S4 domain-containing protein, partial [Granulosicoccaceae bacterium]